MKKQKIYLINFNNVRKISTFKENDVAIKIFVHIIQVLKGNGVIYLDTVFSDGKLSKSKP